MTLFKCCEVSVSVVVALQFILILSKSAWTLPFISCSCSVTGSGRKMNKLARLTISSMIVMDVHARDVTQHLVESKVENNTDFSWLAQLRYDWDHWEDDEAERKKQKTISSVKYVYLLAFCSVSLASFLFCLSLPNSCFLSSLNL